MSKRRPRVVIRGAGVAAVTAAQLLTRRGAEVQVCRRPLGRGRIIAIPIETVALMADLLGVDIVSLRLGPLVDRRQVDWSAEGPIVTPQTALICDAAVLADALSARLNAQDAIAEGDHADADWILEASGRVTAGCAPAGDRVGRFARVPEWQGSPELTVTAVATGWTFTAPHPSGGLAVLLVSPSAPACAANAAAVAESLSASGVRVSHRAVTEISELQAVAPALADPLCAGARLRIGEAALALDPLGGDGLGFALRGALLAQAVLLAIEAGSDRERCLAHYSTRLCRAFVTHLRGCCEYYRTARHAEMWERDIARMDAIADRLDHQTGPTEFRIEGHDLVPVSDRRDQVLRL